MRISSEFVLFVLACLFILNIAVIFDVKADVDSMISLDHPYSHTFSYDRIGNITCNSDSMGLMFRCGDLVYKTTVSLNDSVYRGRVYTYNKTNSSVIHRLTGCYTMENNSVVDDPECNDFLVFTGDNNRRSDDIVQRESILLQEVQYVKYN